MKNNLKFYEEVGRLKSLPRTGWVKRGIPNPETVAEHMYRSQFIAYDLAKTFQQNAVECAHIMMIHDLPEARAGDITPHCNVTKEEKLNKEHQAAVYLSSLSGNSEFLELFEEYEEKETLRSKIGNDADQLECLVQVMEYSSLYPEKISLMENFWPYAENKISTEHGHNLYKQMKKEYKLQLEAAPKNV